LSGKRKEEDLSAESRIRDIPASSPPASQRLRFGRQPAKTAPAGTTASDGKQQPPSGSSQLVSKSNDWARRIL